MNQFDICVALLMVASLVASPAQAGDSMACDTSPKWETWSRECERRSAAYKAEWPISAGGKTIDAQCSDSYYLTRVESTRCRQYKMTDNHVHVMIAEAFYAKRKDHRQQALYTLSHY